MPKDPLTHFEPDAERLAVMQMCMDSYGVGEPTAEWPNNLLSLRTVVYESGVIAKQGVVVRHAADPNELALCRQLAAEAAALMADVPVGMGSESSDTFHGFFIAATLGDSVPTGIDEALIRKRFGDTIFPPATVVVETLTDAGRWWSDVEADGEGSEPEYFAPWHAMIAWFRNHSEFVDSSFVKIGDSRELWKLSMDDMPEGTEATGCVLPRLALGLTANGSLVGLFGHTVQT